MALATAILTILLGFFGRRSSRLAIRSRFHTIRNRVRGNATERSLIRFGEVPARPGAKIEGCGGGDGERSTSDMSDSIHTRLEQA